MVAEVDRGRREVRVEVPGITDGAALMPLAEIEYPIGDSSEQTEIRVLPGDRVWVVFERGDPRYPIITGYRTKRVGNVVGWRRWFHDSFEIIADLIHRVKAGTKAEVDAGEEVHLHVGGTEIKITNGRIELTAGGSTIVMDGGGIKLNGTRIDLN